MAIRNRKIQEYVPNGLAFAAGVIAALLMIIVLAIARSMDLTGMSMGRLLGTMVTGEPTLSTWWLGFGLHLLLGGLFGLIYAGAFRALGRSGAGIGAMFAIAHWLIVGLALAFLPAIHPIIPQEMAAPGIFLSNMSLFTMLAFFALHIMYGAIVGGIYQSAAEQSRSQIRRVVTT